MRTFTSVKSHIDSARRLAKRDGWIYVFNHAVRKVRGKVNRKFRKVFRKKNTGSKLEIAFYPTGGFGDYIISAKLLEELLETVKCNITVFVEKPEFGAAIYGNRENVRVKDFEYYELQLGDYDLALTVEHFVHVKNMDETRVKNIAPDLYRRLRYLIDNWSELYVEVDRQWYREANRFHQCKVQGLDRWTELRMGKTFEIKDKKVIIPMDMNYESEFQKLSFANKTFITMNCGTDAMRMSGTQQTKTWPDNYYDKLAALIKEKYPDIIIVQLGAADGTKLNNIDFHMMGQSIELAKWILKNSVLHIDIEGGLVHLATQLDTKCLVLFGPTPMHMYAYSQNINLNSQVCSWCMGTHEDWAYKCYRGFEEPPCMYQITPAMVMDEIEKYIDSKEC